MFYWTWPQKRNLWIGNQLIEKYSGHQGFILIELCGTTVYCRYWTWPVDYLQSLVSWDWNG